MSTRDLIDYRETLYLLRYAYDEGIRLKKDEDFTEDCFGTFFELLDNWEEMKWLDDNYTEEDKDGEEVVIEDVFVLRIEHPVIERHERLYADKELLYLLSKEDTTAYMELGVEIDTAYNMMHEGFYGSHIGYPEDNPYELNIIYENWISPVPVFRGLLELIDNMKKVLEILDKYLKEENDN